MYIPWYDEDELNIEYKECIITYIDIMGFKRLVEESVAALGVRDGILDSLREINAAVGDRGLFYGGERQAHLEDFEVRSFSDLIVRFRPFGEKTDRDFAVFREVLDLCSAQMRLLGRGILVRGGMTIGQLYYDESHVFGPGLVRAYELESRLAIYPRIITELSLARSYSKYLIEEAKYPYLEIDSDGIPFLSYISPNTCFFADEINTLPLHHAHTAIELNLRETRADVASDRQKLLWVCNKYNKLVKELTTTKKSQSAWLESLVIDPALYTKAPA